MFEIIEKYVEEWNLGCINCMSNSVCNSDRRENKIYGTGIGE